VAAATTPAPLPASESVDQAHEGSGIIPGDRPEFPLPTLNDQHHFLATPRGIDRPRTPPELSFEDSRALLTRLTGLQPWQLEAFPDELPPLPLSRPSSPLRSPEPSRPPPQVRPRRLSSTAVPIRFRKPPVPPSVHRDLAVEPEPRSVSPGTSPVRSRHGKAPSAEFKTSREIRPLYLLERNRKSAEIDDLLPALPSSGSPSRASSSTDTDAEYESALESPRPSDNVTPEDAYFDPLSAVSDLITGRPGPELQHPELIDREFEEIDESGQVTPKASDFPTVVPTGSVGPARDVLAAALEDVKAKSASTSSRPASPLAPSAPLDDTKMRDIPAVRSGTASPTNSSSRLQTAAFGAAIGGLTAAALRNRTPSPFEVLTGGRRLSGDRKIVPETALVPTEPDDVDLGRDIKGKGRAERNDVVSESPISATVDEVSDHKQFIPTFNDNEDDWVKNKSESIVTDDATLVAEQTSGPAVAKELQSGKVLESTAPQGDESIEVRRAIFGEGDKPQDGARPTSVAPTDDFEKTLADIRHEQESAQTTAEDVVAATPKGKKNKKNKKGKRGSQQVEVEPASLPEEPTSEDKIMRDLETQQETIEREILEPSFPSADQEAKKIDVMDFLEKNDQTVAPESSTTVEVQKDTTPVPSVVEPVMPVVEPPLSVAKAFEQPKSAAPILIAQEPVEPKSGWGSGLWGALGWGKKRAPSPTPTPEPKPAAASVAEEKRELQVPPSPVVPVEAKQPEVEAEIASVKNEPARESAIAKDVQPARETTTTPAFVVPQTAYFTDGGKPHFSFPQPSIKVAEESAREVNVDVAPFDPARNIEETPKELKRTYANVPPPTAFFTDDGKPHFTFSQPTVRSIEEISQTPSSSATEQAIDGTPSTLPTVSGDILKERTIRDFMPSTAFFTDDGKPHFTFPQPLIKPVQGVAPEPSLTTVDEQAVPAEPTESASSKKKKSKKDKKKRGSVATSEPDPVEPEASSATRESRKIPDENVDEQQVQQFSEDIVTDTPAMDKATTLLRETQPDHAPEPATGTNLNAPKDITLIEPPAVPVAMETALSAPLGENVAASSSKKKNKKAKKAMRESTQIFAVDENEPSTPVAERSLDFTPTESEDVRLDAGVDVPLPAETLQEKDDLAEPVKEPTQEAPVVTKLDPEITIKDARRQLLSTEEANVQDLDPLTQAAKSAPVEPEATEIASTATDTPKKKKSKKSKSKSGIQTPDVQAEPLIESAAPAVELSNASREVVDVPKELDQRSEPNVPVVDTVVPKVKPFEDPETPLEQAKLLEVEATPIEQAQPQETVPTPAEPSIEPEEFTSMSKKDKKKKKGKLAKDTETPVEETLKKSDISTAIETSAERSVQPEEIQLPTQLDGELDLPMEEATASPQLGVSHQDQVDTKDYTSSLENVQAIAQPEQIRLPAESEGELDLPAEQTTAPPRLAADIQDQGDSQEPTSSVKPTEVIAQADIVPETTSRDVVDLATDATLAPEPAQTEPIAAIEDQPSTPIIIQPTETTAYDEFAMPASSKKDKKKKKGKKSKAADETEPATPVTEVQRELEASVEPTQPELIIETLQSEADVPLPEQAVEEVAQLESTPEDAMVTKDKPIETSSVQQPAADSPILALEQPMQALPTPVEEEAATSSKKVKKKMRKKGKSVDIEPSAVDTPEATTDPDPIVEPINAEPVVEVSPAPHLDEPQEVPLPVETPGELISESFKTTKEVVDLASRPEEPQEVPLPVESPGELVPELIDAVEEVQDLPAPVLVEPSRKIEEPMVQEIPEITSKKSKKKKAKKGKSLDTEPSTPISEEPFTSFDGSAEPSVIDKIDDTSEAQQQVPVTDEVVPVKGIQSVPEPTPVSPVLDDSSLPAIEQRVQDTAASTAIDAAVESEGAELISKKAKKKKAKKAKCTDVTEPSTPTTDEPSRQLGEPSESAVVERRSDEVAQPVVEQPASVVTAPPTIADTLSEPFLKAEESNIAPAAELSTQDVVEPATPTEPAVEEPVVEPTSKKAKKKKGKKAKTDEEKEPETLSDNARDAVEPVADIMQAEETTQPLEPLVAESPAESAALVSETLATPLTEEPIERELVTELGQLSEPIDFEIPMDTPVVEAETPFEVSAPLEGSALQAEETVEDADATSTSKKAKKKKGKKSKSISEPQIPVAEVESFTPTTSEAPEAEPVPAPVEQPIVQEEVTTTESEASQSTKTRDVEQTMTELVEPVQATEELHHHEAPSETAPVQPTGQAAEQATEAPISRADKKKAKRAKRVSSAEETTSTPATPTEELLRELGSRANTTDVPAEAATIFEPVSPKSIPVNLSRQEDVLPTTNLEDIVPELASAAEPEVVVESQAGPAEQAQDVVVDPEQVQPVEEEATSSKKSKKKAKKDKRKSITENEPSTPLDTPAQELERAPLDNEPVSMPDIVAESKDKAVSTAIDLEPATIASVSVSEETTNTVAGVSQEEQLVLEPTVTDEVQQSEPATIAQDAPLSKKDQKKTKKNKRVSIAEPESTITTPTDEKAVSLEDETVPVVQLPEPAQDEATSSSIEVQQTAPSQIVEEPKQIASNVQSEEMVQPVATVTTEDQRPQQAVEDESATLPKKDKKKTKKAKRVSIAEPESAPATPAEEKKELVLPLEQPQASESIAIEEAAPAVPLVEELTSRDLPAEGSTPVAGALEDLSSIPAPIEEPVTAFIEEEASTSAPKKDKKKGKKAKRGSIAESGTSTPLETPIEEKAQDPLDVQRPLSTLAIEEQVSESPAPEEPATPLPPADDAQKNVEDKATATVSKKDKKKAKQSAKSGSVAAPETSEPSTPIESSTQEVADVNTGNQSIVTASDVENPVIVAPTGGQPAVALREVTEPESPEPAREQAKDISVEDESLAAPSAAEEPVTMVPIEASQSEATPTAAENASKDIAQEEAASALLAKKDKKRARKSKRESVPEIEVAEPSTPVEQALEAVKDTSVEEQPIAAPSISEESVAVASTEEQDISQPPRGQEVVPTPLVEESKEEQLAIASMKPLPIEETTDSSVPLAEEVKDVDAEPAEWANLSKAQKKKAKKAKRVSVVESEPSQPVTPAEELTKELTLEKEPATETAEVRERPAALTVDEPSTAVEQSEAPATVQEPVEAVEEPTIKSKKEKKKAKKSKATSVVEGEPSQPATPIEELSRELAPSIEQPAITSTKDVAANSGPVEVEIPIESVAEEPAVQPSVEASVATPIEPLVESIPAVEDDASASVSKKDKKKAKKAKRASGIEDQASLPATPVEEVTKELGIKDQPVVIEQPTIGEPPVAHDTPPPDQATEQAPTAEMPAEPVEESTKPSKKDKKKAKKQQKESKSETVPFLALETPEEANVSDTQSSPPPSIPSETPLLLSGIPTSYPHVRDIAFVENGGESVRDERVGVVDDKDLEPKLDVEQSEKQQELVVEDADGEKNEKTKKDKKGKKRASILEELVPEAPSTVDVADTTPAEPPLLEQSEPASEVAATEREVVLPEQPVTQVHTIETQLPETQPIEETKVAPEEATTTIPAEPEQKKVKKHKLAAMFEQKAAEDKPIFPRKRAPWVKPVSDTSIIESAGETSKDVKVVEAVPIAPAEPTVNIDESAKLSQVFALPQDDVEPIAPEPAATESVIEKPVEPTEKASELTEEQSSAPISVVQPLTETVADTESSLITKKDKKKAKKDKKSDTATPVEAEPEVQIVPLEEPIAQRIDKVEPDFVSLAQREVPVETKEQQSEASEDVQTQPTTSVEPQELVEKLPLQTPIEVETLVEPVPTVVDEAIVAPSKKDKKKNKKAKKQSGTATPVEEAVPDTQPEKLEEAPAPVSEQFVVEAVTEAAPVLEQPTILREEDAEPSTTDQTIETLQDELLPVAPDSVNDVSKQENVQPTDDIANEVAEPIEEDSTAKLSKKDKKKGKKSKKSTGVDTPMTEEAPEVEQKAIEEIKIEQVEEATPTPIIEPEKVSESTDKPWVDDTQATPIDKAIEPPRHDEASTTVMKAVADVPQDVQATSEPTQPAEDDWGYTPPKKDKKKSKKAKKTDGLAPQAESVSGFPREIGEAVITPVVEQLQAPADNIITPDSTTKDTTEANTVPVPNLDDKQLGTERALDATATDITEAIPLPTASLPVEVSVEDEASTPLAKKEKKKAKKAKKSGLSTPITEEFPIVQPEDIQEPVADEAAAVEGPVEEVPASSTYNEPVVEQPHEPEQIEPPSSVVSKLEPLNEEPALPAPTTEEIAEKDVYVVMDPIVTQAEDALSANTIQGTEIATTQARAVTLDDAPGVTIQELPATEEQREIERLGPDFAPITEVEPQLDEVSSPITSKKKSKKKGKKSGTATPITEDVPVSAHKLTQHVEVQAEHRIAHVPEPVPTFDQGTIAQDISAPAAQAESVLEEHALAEQPEIPAIPQEAEIETKIDEQTSTSALKKSKKKAEKSGTAIPIIDDVTVPQQETTQELQDTPAVVENAETVMPERDHDVSVAKDLDTKEEDVAPAPVAPEPESILQLEEEVASASSKKKLKKKAKKSGIATPITEDVPQVKSEDVPPTIEEFAMTDHDVRVLTDPVSDLPAPQTDALVTPEPVLASEPEAVAPAEETIGAETNHQIVTIPEDPIILPVPVVEDSTTASKKKKKNKGKKSEPQTPIIELSDPLATETRTIISEDVQHAPVTEATEVAVQALIPEATAIPDAVPQETRAEVAEEEKPVFSRKLSKKEKKTRKNSAAPNMDVEPLAEAQAPIEHLVEPVPAPGAVPVLVEEPRQLSTVEDPQVPTTTEPSIIRDVPEVPVPAVDEPVAAPLDDQPESLTAQDGSTPAPTKPKKAKKDKKSKKQSVSLGIVEAVEPTEPGPMEQTLDRVEPLVEPHVDTAVTRDTVPSVTESLEAAAPVEPSTIDVPAYDEPQPGQRSTLHELEVIVHPQIEQTSELAPTQDIKADETTSSLSRKASKKAKKGKKYKDIPFEPAAVLEQPEAMIAAEPVLDPIAPEPLVRGEGLDTVASWKPVDRDLGLETATIDLPAYDAVPEPLTHAVEPDSKPATSIVEATNEAAVQLQPTEDAQPIADEMGALTPSKKSKKERKKVKKSNSTPGTVTPSELVPQPAVTSDNVTMENAEPTLIEEQPREAEVVDPQVTVTELPSEIRTINEVAPTPIVEDIEPVTLPIQEPAHLPIEADEPDLSRSASKKSKKKKDKKAQNTFDELESELPTPTAITKEVLSSVQEPAVGEVEVVPIITDAKREANQPLPPPASERTVATAEPANQGALPVEILTDTTRDISEAELKEIRQAPEEHTEKEELGKPSASLSLDLKAVQDEVADFKLRSEALDQALAASEQLDEPSAPEATSFFDVVGKLSKKDKKKGKKAKSAALDTELTTPAAEETAVETKEIVEEPTLTKIPLQKLSKKDKEKGKQSTSTVEEAAGTFSEEVAPVVEIQEQTVEQPREETGLVAEATSQEPVMPVEAPVVSIEEVTPIPLEDPVHTQEVPVVEAPRLDFSGPEKGLAIEEDRSSVSRKLSKKDKKKSKTGPLADDKSTLEPSIAQLDSTSDTRELTTSEEPVVMEVAPVVEEPLVTSITLEVPETSLEQDRPSVSRKQSKKDKKKAKKSVSIDEPTETQGAQDSVMEDVLRTEGLPIQPVVTDTSAPGEVSTDTVPATPTGTNVVDVQKDTSATLENLAPSTSRGGIDEIVSVESPAIVDYKASDADIQKSEKEEIKEPATTSILDNSFENIQPSTLRPVAIEPMVDPEPTQVTVPAIDAEDERAWPSKKNKKEKRKSKATTTPDVALETESTSVSRDLVQEEPRQEVVPTAEPEIEPASKPSKKEKRKSKKSTTSYEEEPVAPLETEPELVPVNIKEQVTERAVDTSVAEKAVDLQSTGSGPIPDIEPSAAVKNLDAPELPALSRKPSRTHKLAAMFEQGASHEGSAAQQELRKGGSGSVKDLAKQYETQSRSVTPVQLPVSEKRTISRVTSEARLRSESPKKDIDFAGTIAAGLKISGFDDKYVVNNSTFHQSTSPHGARDITTDDDVAAALDSASASKFATRGWTTPTSSPKLRPTKESESDTLPPIEVAIASTDHASFDPLDVLNDPAFSKQSASPRGLEEADPDELGSKLKMNKKSDGKKKRTSLPESPVEAVRVTLPSEPTNSRSIEPQQIDTQPERRLLEHDDTWPAEPTKGKKAKKDKKRASLAQESVEHAVAETLAVEALAREPPAVEPIATDSTVGESKPAKPLPPIPGSEAPAAQGMPDDLPSPQIMGRELDEYPFPQVSGPEGKVSRDVEKRLTRTEREEQEEGEGSGVSAKKKSKKSRKGKEKDEQVIDVKRDESHDRSIGSVQEPAHETHKRRSHPVTFEEDQPYEKRTHLREATPELRQETTAATARDTAGNDKSLRSTTKVHEVQPKSRGLGPSDEPTWSFAGVRDSAVEVDDSPVQSSAPSFQESTRDGGYHDAGHNPVLPHEQVSQVSRETTSSREQKRRSKEPRTPREKAIRNSQDVERSPALPEYSASAEVMTPGRQEYATKERTSYLFDSSPSTRAYGTSPAVEATTPAQESRSAGASSTREVSEPTRSSKKLNAGTRDKQVSPSEQAAQKEPYQSIFGDPNEKTSGPSSSLITPLSKHGRTPSNNQLHTITETSPPDDSPLHKKGRAINDVGAPDRGTKSLRRTESPKPFSERLKSPPPVTPTPLSRRGVPTAPDTAGRASPSIESPWSQVNDKVDRTMTLSPARRMPRSSPSFDPIKQHMAEQRSPSALSQRSMSNISKLRSPDQEQRPLSSASNRSTQSLRRVDRSASGDLRSVARLGEAHAQDANDPEPNLSGIALATGAAAAIAGIAGASKYDPVRGAGKGRRASMAAETFVSVRT
jgi:hypothetical protein